MAVGEGGFPKRRPHSSGNPRSYQAAMSCNSLQRRDFATWVLIACGMIGLNRRHRLHIDRPHGLHFRLADALERSVINAKIIPMAKARILVARVGQAPCPAAVRWAVAMRARVSSAACAGIASRDRRLRGNGKAKAIECALTGPIVAIG